MTEKIGKVVLDYTYYAGEDVYSDGSIEDELLKIVQEHPVEEYPEMIEKEKNWPVFYHLSPFRTNIIDWLPFKKTDRVLEIGSGCGAITGSLAEKCGHVTCIDLSKKRSMVNAYRNQDKDNITIMVGNFKDIEPHLPTDYDYVLLIGVFEYGQAYIGGATPYEDFMAICNKHRSKNGRLIIAIENKFGLKYWAGCREDHLGSFYSGLEGYRDGGVARTFTRNGLEKIMKKVGIGNYSFYYPYPDYKFMTAIYSDRYLPRKGELSNNLRNFDRDRMINFDEKQVFDQIIGEEEFPLFSNSYLVVIGKTPEVIYTKFSNDRAKPWAIRTAIFEDVFGEKHVEKIPDNRMALAHLKNTAKAYELLSKRYEGTKIEIDPCKIIGEKKELPGGNHGSHYASKGLSFAYCQGKTLEGLLDECLAKGDVAGFKALIEEYMHWLSYGESAACSNIDFIFPNIIVNGDKWQVIDYEWTFEKLIPAKEIAFRAFYNYLLGSEVREFCRELLFEDILHLSQEEIEEYIADEAEFQHFIAGERAAVADMRELIGFKAYDSKEMQKFFLAKDTKCVYQLFFDQGAGFTEENSIHQTEGYIAINQLETTVSLPEGIRQLRLDPCEFACIVRIREICVDHKVIANDKVLTNGTWINGKDIVFATNDPNMTIPCENAKSVTFRLEVHELPPETAENIADKFKKSMKKFF